MDEKHPNRKKDKSNPYTLSIENNIYYISFTDGQGIFHNQEISTDLYDAFNRFELEDISQMNEVSRYYEQSELIEGTLNRRALVQPESVDDGVYRKIMYDQLHSAIRQLPIVQQRRLLLYYFGGFTLEKIAEMEGCKHPAISKSIRAAEKNLKSLLRK